jgi:DNA-binding transcriptional LysR family regulator
MVDTPGRLTLWGIEVFATVAEEQSVSAAARRLGASPSAVSQQLSNLEAAIGTTLVDRSARPLELTSAGTLFRRRAQVILDEATAAKVELSSCEMTSLERVSLGVIEDFDSEVTPQFLSQMAATLSGTRFLLETGASHRLYDLLEARTLDMIVATQSDAPADWMELYPLLEEPFVMVVPKGQGAELPEDLPFLQYTRRHLMGRQIAEHFEREGLRFKARFEIDSYRSILAMVASGGGWSVLTPLGVMYAGTRVNDVDVVPLPGAPMSRRISLVARRDMLFDMPSTVAERLRPLLSELIVSPSRARIPWLGDRLRVL